MADILREEGAGLGELFLHRAGESGDVVFDENEVHHDRGEDADQGAGHELAPLEYVATDELGRHPD